MFARLYFYGKGKKGILLPEDVILKRGEITGVNVLKDSKLEFRLIRTGMLYKNKIEVISGLKSGDKVVLVK